MRKNSKNPCFIGSSSTGSGDGYGYTFKDPALLIYYSPKYFNYFFLFSVLPNSAV